MLDLDGGFSGGEDDFGDCICYEIDGNLVFFLNMILGAFFYLVLFRKRMRQKACGYEMGHKKLPTIRQ